MEKWNQLLFALCIWYICCVTFKRIMECGKATILRMENSKKWHEKMKIMQAWLFNKYTDGVEGKPWIGASRSCSLGRWWPQPACHSVKAKAAWESRWLALERGEGPLAKGNSQTISVRCSGLSRVLTCILRAKLTPESRLPGRIWELRLTGRIEWSQRPNRPHRGVLRRCWLASCMEMFDSI